MANNDKVNAQVMQGGSPALADCVLSLMREVETLPDESVAEVLDFAKFLRMRRPLTVAIIQRALKPVFRRNGVRKAVLFGSYAKGAAKASSDVDLMVDTDLTGLDFFGLVGEIDEALGNDKKIDLLRSKDVEKGSRLDNEIRETGVVIYAE